MRRSSVTLGGLALILSACGLFTTPEMPLFTIQNESDESVDLYRISRADGPPDGPDLITTLAPGDTFETDFGKVRCSTDYTYIAEIDGREVATLGARLCTGVTESVLDD